MQGGTLTLDGLTPEQISVPAWRARVTYVPQTRVLNKGTPSELYFAAQVLDSGSEMHWHGRIMLEKICLHEDWTLQYNSLLLHKLDQIMGFHRGVFASALDQWPCAAAIQIPEGAAKI